MNSLPQVAIIELGSQTTLLIEQRLRELGVRSVILDPKRAESWLWKNPVMAIILSGGASSVYDKDALQPPKDILTLRKKNGWLVPVLGICYGMQWIAHHLGGTVAAGSHEYGPTKMKRRDTNGELFRDTPEMQTVWMSHSDSVTIEPNGFTVLGYTSAIAAMASDSVWGVQFHPEAQETEWGRKIFSNFLKATGCEQDWKPSSIADSIREGILEKMKKDDRAIFGFSGGVDSTTLAALASPALKDRLLAITIDGGHLRENELEEIKRHAEAASVQLKIIDARKQFDEVMADTIDAEEKRKRFKNVYAYLFMQAAEDFKAKVVFQGTLAPDRIESGATGGAVIKSHHNVNLNMGKLIQLHPIDNLFKYEVRALAQEIGLPESVWKRQPFPGPGLFIRVVGMPATQRNLEIVRWADARVKEILERASVYDDISQLVVAYVQALTVGIKGDARAYKPVIVVRAIKTVDFMTGKGVHFSEEIENEIQRVVATHPEIGRVWYDAMDKPPGTTEME